jgi:hypothetical protein
MSAFTSTQHSRFTGLKLAYERALVVGAGRASNPAAREKSGTGMFHVVVSHE